MDRPRICRKQLRRVRSFLKLQTAKVYKNRAGETKCAGNPALFRSGCRKRRHQNYVLLVCLKCGIRMEQLVRKIPLFYLSFSLPWFQHSCHCPLYNFILFHLCSLSIYLLDCTLTFEALKKKHQLQPWMLWKDKHSLPFPRPEASISKKHKHTQELWVYMRLGWHGSWLALG